MHTEQGITLTHQYQLVPAPPPVNLSLLKLDEDKHWGRKDGMPFAQFRKATSKTQFHFPRKGQHQRNTADEWIRLANGEKWTNAALGYVAVSCLGSKHTPGTMGCFVSRNAWLFKQNLSPHLQI